MEKKTPASFSPKAFLKSRHPERFSDSVLVNETELDRCLLEYHLSTITSRSQEADFARFAHRLCEKEVCPNLLPQTGPTGGGDSKVDSETYPIADALAAGWYEGIGKLAASERWAFAFSANAKWDPKCKSDIAKIAATKRGYAKAFFVTNQLVPDKKRATREDDLRKKYGFDVRILDRTWILDRVFRGRHEVLAAEELKVTALSRTKLAKGLLDEARERELLIVEARLRDALSDGHGGSHIAEDALEAAMLASSLERSRADVEGRFARAQELAVQFGMERQQVEAAYQAAWTAFWWFEDAAELARLYEKVEALAIGSHNPFDLERLTALWHVLHGSVIRKTLTPEQAKFEPRTKALVEALKKMRNDELRPSAALQARMFLCEIGLARNPKSKELADGYLSSLKEIVEQSRGLVGFPLKPLAEFIRQMAPAFVESTAYAELFEAIVVTVSQREGEVSGARLLLERGRSQLAQGRPTDAIATLGRALARLYKHESRHDLLHALYLCGCAYEEIGLPWAARGTILNAASVAVNDLWQYGNVHPGLAACFRRLKSLEVSLGRVPHALMWHEVDVATRSHLGHRGTVPDVEEAPEFVFQWLLGRLFLRAEHNNIKELGALPDVLDRLQLPLAADALLFVLGYEDRVRQVAKDVMEKDVAEFLADWTNAAVDWTIADQPEFHDRSTAEMSSRVLGCRVTVACENNPPCVEVGESFLAALESFLATGILKETMALEPALSVRIRTSDFVEPLVAHEVELREGRPLALSVGRSIPILFLQNNNSLCEMPSSKRRLVPLRTPYGSKAV